MDCHMAPESRVDLASGVEREPWDPARPPSRFVPGASTRPSRSGSTATPSASIAASTSTRAAAATRSSPPAAIPTRAPSWSGPSPTHDGEPLRLDLQARPEDAGLYRLWPHDHGDRGVAAARRTRAPRHHRAARAIKTIRRVRRDVVTTEPSSIHGIASKSKDAMPTQCPWKAKRAAPDEVPPAKLRGWRAYFRFLAAFLVAFLAAFFFAAIVGFLFPMWFRDTDPSVSHEPSSLEHGCEYVPINVPHLRPDHRTCPRIGTRTLFVRRES